MKKILNILLFLPLILTTAAQEPIVQVIRGRVVDAVTGYALVGANVILTGSDPITGTSTDRNGHFLLEDVPLGRQGLEIRYIGYRTRQVPNLYLSSGKEIQLEVPLEENVLDMEEVEIRYEKSKVDAQNEMAIVSSRTFSVEETERYAGSLGDPARMVANFAGVMTYNDSRNDIIIRGNSPIGVLWRLEGVEIPNPNHFGALGSTGGPVCMVNNNLLRDSDFLTGAFPAEFGNATAGVFDLHMRSGNRGRHEFLGQVGFNGFEGGIEGPLFSSGKSQVATYLVNYRYSTLGLMDDLGFSIGTGSAVPRYQDLTYMVDVPGTRSGRWKLFGLWGNSHIELGRSKEDTTGNAYNSRGTATDFASRLGVIALSNTLFISPGIRLISTLSYQATGAATVLDSLKDNGETVWPFVRQNGREGKFSYSVQFRHKVNSRNHYQVGLVADLLTIDRIDSIRLPEYGGFINRLETKGNMGLLRAYTQWHHSFGGRFSSVLGVHTQYFGLNNEFVAEPRAAFNWQVAAGRSLTLGYGLHSQIQPRSTYFFQTYDQGTGRYYTTNEGLGFTRSHHLVLGYHHLLRRDFRIKAETYYQYLYRVPVSSSFGEFSMINAGDFFTIPGVENLENKGTGYNYGMELSVERFLNRGFYFLFTTSLFESRYRGADGVLRNTTFNGNYVANMLTGYEKKIGKKAYITLDLKTVLAGGRRHVPIDVEASLAQGTEVRDWNRAYEGKYGDYFRTDLRIGLKLNYRKFSQEWAADLQNLTGYQSLFMEGIDLTTGEIYKVYQQGFYPMFLYRIQF